MSAVLHDSVEFGQTRIQFEARRSARRQSISVIVEGGAVQVLAPTTTSVQGLRDVVRRKGPWILQKQEAHAELTATPLSRREFVGGEGVRYLGRQYRLRLVPSPSPVRLVGGHLDSPQGGRDEVRAALMLWYRRQAQRRFVERVERAARILGQDVPVVLIREQEKRWGSCDAQGRLRLNWRLVQAPLGLVDLVVTHELVHREHHHHGPAFWRRLGQVLPDHRERQYRLDRMGTELYW